MSDSVKAAPAVPAKGKGKKVKAPSEAPKVKKPAAKPTHPKVSEMVVASITSLKERGGSSLLAIKKHMAATYKVDCDKLAPFIKRFLKSAVDNGTLAQPKGRGANGSFKLPSKVKAVKKTPKPKNLSSPKAKKVSTIKVKKPVAKKLAKSPAKKPADKKSAAKKPEAAKKPAANKKPAVAKKQASSPKKSKK